MVSINTNKKVIKKEFFSMGSSTLRRVLSGDFPKFLDALFIFAPTFSKDDKTEFSPTAKNLTT